VDAAVESMLNPSIWKTMSGVYNEQNKSMPANAVLHSMANEEALMAQSQRERQ
jgi:hypothetical protein